MAKKPSTGNAFDLSTTTLNFSTDKKFNGVNLAKASAQSAGIGMIEYHQNGVKAKTAIKNKYIAKQYIKPKGTL
jgi:hypothetical protein